MKIKLFEVFVIIFICAVLIEISSFILIKLKLLPNGLTPRITLIQNKDFAYWHHKNKKFKLASKCWSSKISYNNYGMRQLKNIEFFKSKPRIGIIGDSMTENLEVSDGKDFLNLLQKKLPDYEILNFSVRSLGLGDQIELYDKFAKKFMLDYIFLFISDNDFEDNSIQRKDRPTQIVYKVYDGKVVKEKIRTTKFIFEKSKFEQFKDNLVLTIKQHLNSYILYFHTKNYINYHLNKSDFEKSSNFIQITENLKNKKTIYNFMINKFFEKLSNNEKVYVFVNPRPKIIQRKNSPEKENIKIMKSLWGEKKIIDPTEEGKKYLKKINKYFYPFFSFSCDGHYSELGAEFMSKFVSEYFLSR